MLGCQLRLLFISRAGAMTPQHAHPGGVPIRARRMAMMHRAGSIPFPRTGELSVSPPLAAS